MMRRVRIAAAIAALTVFAPAAAHAQVPPSLLSLPLAGAWDSAPHNLSTARNVETLYTLYGVGVDELFGMGDLKAGRKGVVARFARAPLDVYVAWLATLASHEFGHCQQAWLGGSQDCHWVSAPGPYALGHIITVGDAGHLTSAGRMATTAGGVQATIAGSLALKRELVESGASHWTTSPLLVLRQLDFTLYGLSAPSPAEAQPQDFANDMTNYAIRYGARSGRGGETVHTDIVHGALWNLADPMTWTGAYTYVADYVVRGRPTTRTVGIHAAGLSWSATTNAWLSEVGVRYALAVFVRDSRGHVLEITPSWGEGQPAVTGRLSHAILPGLRVRVGADVWSQRASAVPGPHATGGAIGGGIANTAGRLIVSANVGYKSTGVMLGQPQGAGWFWGVGGEFWVRR
jgi:hypothetical protein